MGADYTGSGYLSTFAGARNGRRPAETSAASAVSSASDAVLSPSTLTPPGFTVAPKVVTTKRRMTAALRRQAGGVRLDEVDDVARWMAAHRGVLPGRDQLGLKVPGTDRAPRPG